MAFKELSNNDAAPSSLLHSNGKKHPAGISTSSKRLKVTSVVYAEPKVDVTDIYVAALNELFHRGGADLREVNRPYKQI